MTGRTNDPRKLDLPTVNDADDAFAERVRERLNDEANALNGPTLSRLNRARQAALAEMPASRRGFLAGINWAPLSAVGLAACLVIVLWFAEPGLNDPELVNAGQSRGEVAAELTATDFELMIAAEDPDMLAELEFYEWLELQAESVRGSQDATG